MFVRTQRLTLRPGWREDAPELARAIGHESVVRNLARAPWPYTIEAAETFAGSFDRPEEPKFLIFEHHQGGLRLVGGMAVGPMENELHEFGYWITPDAWGRGYATEAGAAVLGAARAAGIRKVTARHFLDNPASGRVLRKLGFRPTGRVAPVYSRGRGAAAPSAQFEIDLAEAGTVDNDPRARMAA
ncbi:GNAT family N-acetyltransferase [Sphingomonas psychrotolerans]|uniref:GNAT family N-acetyltransferase n=1 Tax=Sphingomonas psychrotolerans TaxID=1327635 RepID=A0ABU3N930_9SPHN|nr:GNAT family N-acetyltransferase [Sphingomonas psychrotolerans]MDT8760983.1 GNAT family N-acetyltransferase [Sphingomonas psychrotolerans]